MSLSKNEINHLCRMSALNPTDPKITDIIPDIEQIIDATTSVTKLDTADLPPTSQPIPASTQYRPDTIEPQETTREDLLDLTPSITDHQIKVPKVL